jgi:hypothetical protein
MRGINFRERFNMIKSREYSIKAINESKAFSPMTIVTIFQLI